MLEVVLRGINISEFSALLTVVLTCIIMIANILLWLSTRRTIALQVKSNYSLNHQNIVSGHRDLFLGLLHQPEVLKTFADANGLNAEQWEVQIVSSFFINHAFAHYLNFANGTIEASYLEGFKRDARDLFSLPTVQQHWKKAKSVYSKAFQRFVEDELIGKVEAALATESPQPQPAA